MSDFDGRMAQLRARFLARAEDERAQLIAATATMDRAEILRLSHGLSGSAGVFGFPTISLNAQAVEEAIDDKADEQEVRRRCAVLLARLEEAVQGD